MLDSHLAHVDGSESHQRAFGLLQDDRDHFALVDQRELREFNGNDSEELAIVDVDLACKRGQS